MALLAALVIFTVIARYCFSLSWKQLAEFNTTLFAFTTFWGMGINVIKDEHVMIDILYDGVKPARKRWLAIVNYPHRAGRGAGVHLSGLQVCGRCR